MVMVTPIMATPLSTNGEKTPKTQSSVVQAQGLTLDQFPPELLDKIFSFLNCVGTDVSAVSLTCRRFKQLMNRRPHVVLAKGITLLKHHPLVLLKHEPMARKIFCDYLHFHFSQAERP